MRDYITELYEALENFDCQKVGKIYFGVRDGNISVGREDIVPVCEMFTHEFKDTEPVNDQLIVEITFCVIDSCGKEEGFHELANGLLKLYNHSVTHYGNKKLPGQTAEGLLDYILEYIRMFIASYSDEDMALFGEIIKSQPSVDFRDRLMELVKNDLRDYDDEYRRSVRCITEDIVRKGKTLVEKMGI